MPGIAHNASDVQINTQLNKTTLCLAFSPFECGNAETPRMRYSPLITGPKTFKCPQRGDVEKLPLLKPEISWPPQWLCVDQEFQIAIRWHLSRPAHWMAIHPDNSICPHPSASNFIAAAVSSFLSASTKLSIRYFPLSSASEAAQKSEVSRGLRSAPAAVERDVILAVTLVWDENLILQHGTGSGFISCPSLDFWKRSWAPTNDFHICTASTDLTRHRLGWTCFCRYLSFFIRKISSFHRWFIFTTGTLFEGGPSADKWAQHDAYGRPFNSLLFYKINYF